MIGGIMHIWRFNLTSLLIVATIISGSACANAATPTLFQGKSTKIEADAKKDYILSESDGAWFIMVRKFSGDSAALQAKRLVYEIRAAYKLEAFVFKYDPDQMEMDALSQRLGKNKKFHYQTARAVEYAVLVGGFPTGEDPALQKTLEKLRKCQPKSLQKDVQSQQIVQQFKERAKQDPQYAGYGPLGGATPVPNPLLPIEYFNHKGIVDPFVAKLNSDSKYSLLNNKKTYTVRIATFSGDTSMKRSSDSFDDLNSRLQYAGMRAAALCEALRNSGVEAWEFHDRDCSFVTIGGFDQYGQLQEDGHTELNPQIAQIMKKYGGELVNDESGTSKYRAYTIVVDVPEPGSTGSKPKKRRMSLACDLRPVIIVVPQRSGEENVKKIAMVQKQMDLAREKRDEKNAAATIAEAERDIASVNAFANANGRALSEEEYRAWTASMALGRRQTESSANDVVVQNQQSSGATVQAATNMPYAAESKGVDRVVNAQSKQTIRSNDESRNQAQRVPSTPKPAKTAQRSAAPTY